MTEGQHITPTLRLVRLLGQGGMGSVWVADHLGLGTQVAVKFMSPAFAQNASYVQRFQREAMAAAQIKSPHIAQVFDHGLTFEGIPYIVMELLEGEDLRGRVRRAGPLPPREAAQIIGQAAKALSRAHKLGIVHRDIKPDNIFLVNLDGEVLAKVLDFGIAKLGADPSLGMTSSGSMIGTPLYMSPEQLFSSKHVDLRADLWSLGVVAYFAMTGRPPFHGETLASLSVAIHQGVFPPPSAVRPDLTPAIDVFCLKALQGDPARRFASAKELAEALNEAVGASTGAPASARAPQALSFDASPVPPPVAPPIPAEDSAPGAPPLSRSAPGVQSISVPGPLAVARDSASERTLLGAAVTRGGAPAPRAIAMIAAALLGVAVLGVGIFGALWLRSGEPPHAAAEIRALSAPIVNPAAPALSVIALATAAPMTPPPPPTVNAPSPSAAPLPSADAAGAPTKPKELDPGATASGAPKAAPAKTTAPKATAPAARPKGVEDTIGF